jgi:hypothetical protein
MTPYIFGADYKRGHLILFVCTVYCRYNVIKKNKSEQAFEIIIGHVVADSIITSMQKAFNAWA